MAAGLVLALLAVGATKRAQPSSDCVVTVTHTDGSTEPRDCFVLDPNSKELRAGTKARFESCTQ